MEFTKVILMPHMTNFMVSMDYPSKKQNLKS